MWWICLRIPIFSGQFPKDHDAREFTAEQRGVLGLYSYWDVPVPLLLLTALLVFLVAALIIGVRRDIVANRASPTPERVGLGVVVPLVLAVAFIVAVEIVGFRFWDHLVAVAP